MTVKKIDHAAKILVARTLFGMFFGAGNLIFPVISASWRAGTSSPPSSALSSLPSASHLRRGRHRHPHSDGLQTLSSKVGRATAFSSPVFCI